MSTPTAHITPAAVSSALTDALQHELQALLTEHVATAHALHAERGRMDESSIRGRELSLTGSLTAISIKLDELRRIDAALTWMAANAPAVSAHG